MATHYLILLFLSSCLLSVFYWQVVQPIILKSIRFRLFARRDELRRYAIEKKEDHTSFAYREVENLICKAVAVMPAVSLGSFIWFVINNIDKKDETVTRLRRESSQHLLQIVDKTVRDALFIMFLNSPFITIFCMFVGGCLWVIGKLNRLLIYQKAEDFIDELPSDLAVV